MTFPHESRGQTDSGIVYSILELYLTENKIILRRANLDQLQLRHFVTYSVQQENPVYQYLQPEESIREHGSNTIEFIIK